MTSLFKVEGDHFSLSVPLMKYDARTGEFEGYATVEELDKSGETIDIEKSWPFFAAWSDSFAKATDGASFGNVREQHDPKKAAGKLTAMEKRDFEGKPAIFVKGKAIDPGSKEKLLERVLVGLSIGGSYVEKTDDGRYVANPSEISLVDNPCVPNAMITVVKADGTESLEKALGFQPAQVWKCRSLHDHAKKADAIACESVNAEKFTVGYIGNAQQVNGTVLLHKLDGNATACGAAGEWFNDGCEDIDCPACLRVINLKEIIKSLRVPLATGANITEVHMDEKKPEAAAPETVAKVEESIKPVELANAEPLQKALDGFTKALADISAKQTAQDEAIKVLTSYVGNMPGPAKGVLRTVAKEGDGAEVKKAEAPKTAEEAMKATVSGPPRTY